MAKSFPFFHNTSWFNQIRISESTILLQNLVHSSRHYEPYSIPPAVHSYTHRRAIPHRPQSPKSDVIVLEVYLTHSSFKKPNLNTQKEPQKLSLTHTHGSIFKTEKKKKNGLAPFPAKIYLYTHNDNKMKYETISLSSSKNSSTLIDFSISWVV